MRLSRARGYNADRGHKTLVVNAGEIVEQGSHDELMTQKGFYYTLYMSQFKGKAPNDAEAGSAAFMST